jgi:hypothetical protein
MSAARGCHVRPDGQNRGRDRLGRGRCPIPLRALSRTLGAVPPRMGWRRRPGLSPGRCRRARS